MTYSAWRIGAWRGTGGAAKQVDFGFGPCDPTDRDLWPWQVRYATEVNSALNEALASRGRGAAPPGLTGSTNRHYELGVISDGSPPAAGR